MVEQYTWLDCTPFTQASNRDKGLTKQQHQQLAVAIADFFSVVVGGRESLFLLFLSSHLLPLNLSFSYYEKQPDFFVLVHTSIDLVSPVCGIFISRLFPRWEKQARRKCIIFLFEKPKFIDLIT